MDQDDIALPTRLEKQVEAAANNPRVVAWGAFAHHIDAKGSVIGLSETGPTTEREFYDQRAAGHVPQILHPTAFLRKEIVIRAGGYDPRFDTCEDLELFDRMADYGPVLALPEVLLRYRIHGASFSATHFLKQRRYTSYVFARRRAALRGETPPGLEEYFAARRADPALLRLKRHVHDLSRFYYRQAGQHLAEGHSFRACVSFSVSTVLDPGYALRRIWRQRLSPTARKHLRGERPGNG